MTTDTYTEQSVEPQLTKTMTRLHPSTAKFLLVGVVAYGLLLGSYFVARYNGGWADNDTALLTLNSEAVIKAGSITLGADAYAAGYVYTSGYGLQTLITFISELSGVSPATLQLVVFPLLVFLVGGAMYALAWEVMGSARLAALATILLYIQPELLFMSLRGSHERFTRTMLILELLLLIRSVKVFDNPRLFRNTVITFYVVTFGVISYNALFGASMALAITCALLLGLIVNRYHSRMSDVSLVIQRLAFASASSFILLFMFITYLYKPAADQWSLLRTFGEKIASLLLNFDTKYNAYNTIAEGWVNPYVYLLLSLSNWLLILGSLALWLRIAWQWLRRGRTLDVTEWLLCILYLTFIVQEVISIAVDFTGLIGGNLQLRAFPSYAIVGVLLIVYEGRTLLAKPFVSRSITYIVLTTLIFLSVAALLKATNEPALSNKWVFYLPEEMRALNWADTHSSRNWIWTDVDERINVGYFINYGLHNGNYLVESSDAKRATFFLSDAVITAYAARLNAVLPNVSEANLVYDNGVVRVYRKVPRTPYER